MELVVFQWATLQMPLPSYHSFPYDYHDLPIYVESFSLSSDRLRLVVLNDSTGVDLSGTKSWPGWKYLSHEAKIEHAFSDPLGEDACHPAGSRKSRFSLVVHAKRSASGMAKHVFLPTILLVVSAMTAPMTSSAT